MKRLGKGAQATVSLFHLKEDPAEIFAVKSYIRHPNQSTDDIMREIGFLRDLDICHNIV